jgi:hypothetical protein
MPSHHHNCLLQAADALDRLVWSYRGEIDRCPKAFLTADDLCLSDFANRSAILARRLIDKGPNGREGNSPYPSLSPERQARLHAAIRARRAAKDKDAAQAVSSDLIRSPTAREVPSDHGDYASWQASDDLRSSADDLIERDQADLTHARPKARLH